MDITPMFDDIDTPELSVNHSLEDCTNDMSLDHTSSNSAVDILTKVGYSEDDIASALLHENSKGTIEEGDYGRNRPTTHVFSQGKVFTYPKLEVPEPKGKIRKSRSMVRRDVGASLALGLDPDVSPFIPANENLHIFTSLRSIRIKNLKNVIIGQLNINSLRNKFHALSNIIHGNLDILIITETKLDDTFPQNQFHIPGYRIPYRIDRDALGGGVMIYVREDIPSDILRKHKMDENVETILIEVNLRKTKLLLIAAYNSNNPKYRTPDTEFFQQIAHALDVYSNYDKFILAGDLNMNAFDCVEALEDFMDEFHAKNLVKEPTCYASPSNPSCLDLYITNCYKSFQGTTTVTTGLSDCHKMVITVMKTTFPKIEPRVIKYRDYSTYCPEEFGYELQRNLDIIDGGEYQPFDDVFMNTLQSNYPLKTKTVRSNQQPYVSREMRKGIMTRSRLQHKYWKDGTEESKQLKKKQENYCNRLYKRERKNYYKNLDPKVLEDERKFWLTVKPFYNDKSCGIREKIMLVENGELIDDDTEIAESFNAFFSSSVDALGIVENKLLLNPVSTTDVGVDKCIKMYETHPSIINIKKHVTIEEEFYFSPITAAEMEKKIASLNPKKNGGGIPTRILRDMRSIVSKPLAEIWKKQCIEEKIFPAKLKLGDITAVYKALEKTLKKNYRPITVLSVISKLFEKVMDEQTDAYMDRKLSKYVCGYRKGGYNPQLALTHMIEKMKNSKDNGNHAGAILMDLSKAFDTIKHELLIAKLHAYGFSRDALELIHNFLNDRWHRTKVNNSHSTWKKIACGMPQGSVNGPKWFNIYINDLFFLFTNTEACNIADDTTPFACDKNIRNLIQNLESDTASALMWFDANYMKSNQSKCHFILPSMSPELFWIRVGEQVIWESRYERLLGLGVDKELKFHEHVKTICKKASAKVTALARMIKIMPLGRKKILFNSFVTSQFSHCPLVWMFNLSIVLNARINRLQERGLRIVYDDYSSSFEELLVRDGSVRIHHRNIQLVAVEMFKVKNDLCPELMKCLFQKNTNARDGHTFVIPNVRTEYMGKLSLSYFGPVVWETMLPAEYKSILSLEKFKDEIKKWIPNCKCRLCKERIVLR